MGTVTYLPANPRTLNAMRGAIAARAARVGADERKRRRAFVSALRLMEEGASSAWATQAGCQALSETKPCARYTGPEAA